MVRSKKKYINTLAILIIGLAISIFLQYSFYKDIYLEFLQIGRFILTLIPAIFVLLLFYDFINQPIYIFNKENIDVVKNNQTISITQKEVEIITSFVTEHENNKTKNIFIVTKKGYRLILTSDYYKNIEEIELFLKENYNLENKRLDFEEELNGKYILATIFAIILFLVFINFKTREIGVQKIEVELIDKPFTEHNRKGNIEKVCFKFKGLEAFKTKFNYEKKHRSAIEFSIQQMQPKDKVIIEIPKNYYEKKIAKTQPLNFIEKHFGYYKMPIYYVYDKTSNGILENNPNY
jgi:hypothetical protein